LQRPSPSPRPSWSDRLGRAASRRPRAVAAAYLLVAILSALYGVGAARELVASGLDVPGSESDRAARKLAERLGVGSPDIVALLHRDDGDVRDPDYAGFVVEGLEPLFADAGVLGVTSHYDTGLAALVSHDGRRTLVLVYLAGSQAERVATYTRLEPSLRESFPGVELGGPIPASVLAQRIAEEDIREAELIAMPFALALTLWFFRGLVAALLPIAIGAFALAFSTALTRLVAQFMEVSIFSLSISAFLGLGLSIDYSLLVVQRFREELPRHASVLEAVAATMGTAGRAVRVSGVTVLVSILVLFIVPVPLVHGLALGGVLAAVSALTGALALLPALLAWIGHGVNRFAVGGAHPSGPSRLWAGLAELSMRRPWLTVLVSVVLLALVTLPALRMQAVLPDARTFPRGSEVRNVEERIGDPAQFDPSGASTLQVAVTSEKGPALSPAGVRAVQAWLERVATVPGVQEVRTPFRTLDPERGRESADIAGKMELDRTVHEDLALVNVQAADGWRTSAAAATVNAVRAVPHPGLDVEVGGPTALLVDVRGTLSRYGALVAALVIAWNVGVLFLAFRSVLVPLKAAVVNLLSLAASYGVLVLVFQDGHGAGLLDFEPPGGIEATIPVVMAAIVFGLSMDYEVFLLTRIQEEFAVDGDVRRSIREGVAWSGRVITSAALILLVVIGAFAAGELVFVKEIGVGMASAIVLDVTLVRALLVPAAMKLLGRRAWWAPRALGGEGPVG
jgi:trehalose monomycolate/heme transporter